MPNLFWTKPELDLELLVVTELLNMQSLHYGYWETSPTKIDLDAIRQAQTDYTKTLLEMFPEYVSSVLDVGCGIGDNAAAMVSKGMEVTAISPDQNHGQYIKSLVDGKIDFHNTRIQEFTSDKQFDLVLMSESQDYFPIDIGLSQTKKFVKENGYLLISGFFRNADTPEFKECHIEQDYVDAAARYGFSQIERIDITSNVTPTLDYCAKMVDEFIEKPYSLLDRYAQGNLKLKLWLVKLFFRKQIKQLLEMKAYYDKRFDVELFRDRISYARLLFQKVK